MTDKPVKIFVSSPADVDHERALVKEIIDRLAGEYLTYFELRAILWEEEALTADRTFQAGLTQPEACDIVLVILWTRLGSPLPQEPYRGMTGTEWEFVNAVEASAHDGTPEVLVYKKTAPKLVDITNANVAREAVEDRRRLEDFFRTHFFFEDNSFRRAFRTFDTAVAFRELVETQLRKLLNRRISAERRATAGELRWRGSPFRPDRPFEISDERVFSGREQEARELIRRLEQQAGTDAGLVLLTGPSGSGKTSLVRAGVLARLTRPYQFEDITAVRLCLVDPSEHLDDPLRSLADALSGATVLGEPLSSFGLDADALSRLLTQEPTLAAQQVGSALAASSSGGAHRTGARLLIAIDPLDGVLSTGDDQRLRTLAAALAALAKVQAIWVLALISSDALPKLARLPALQPILQQQGWVEIGPPSAARIRQVVEIPARIAGIDLDADNSSERELIDVLEADISGLQAWAPLVQPVLEQAHRAALARNARNDAGELRLTADDYRATGGIRAEVLRRANRVWEAVDQETRDALPMLCRALISLEGDGSGQPRLRSASLETLRHSPACRRMVQALLDARLAVAEGVSDPGLNVRCAAADYSLRGALAAAWKQTQEDWRQRWRRRIAARPQTAATAPAQAPSTPPSPQSPAATDAGTASPHRGPSTAAGPEGAATPEAEAQGSELSADQHNESGQRWLDYRALVSLSHPALLTLWPPVRQWLSVTANRRALAQRFQLDRQAQLWKRTNCNREYLLRDASYAEAAALAARYPGELEPLELEFLAQSEAQLAFRQRRSRLIRAVVSLLIVLMLLSAISAGLAYRAYTEAQSNLSRSKLNEANLSLTRGNTPQAVSLALSAGIDLPQRAVQTLGLTFSGNRLIAMAPAVSPYPDQPRIPAFSETGDHLATFPAGQGPRLLALEHGRFEPKQALTEGDLDLHTLVFGPETDLFGIGSQGVWRLPAAAGANPDYQCGAEPGLSFTLDQTRTRLAMSRNEDNGKHRICVLDLTRPGRLLLKKTLEDGDIRSLSFSPDGTGLLTASAEGRSRLIEISTGRILQSFPAEAPLGRPFNRAIFDADGGRIAIAAVDERIRLYQRDGTPIAELSSARIGDRRFKMHRSAVRDIAFDPSGNFLVAADDEGQIVRWTLTDGQGAGSPNSQVFDEAVVLNNHRLSAGTVRITPPPANGDFSESLVLSASLDGTARLVGLETGKHIGVLGHDAAVAAAGFHASGQRVATLSTLDETARLWSLTPVSRLAYTLRHPDHVWYVAIASAPPEIAQGIKTLLIATAGFDGGVRVWRYARNGDSDGPTPWAEFLDPAGNEPARQVRFSPTGDRLASAQYDGTARVFDLEEKRTLCVLQVTRSSKGQVYNALFGPDGTWLLTTSDDGSAPVRLFSPSSCQPLPAERLFQHPGTGVEAAFVRKTPDATLVATGDQAGRVQIIRHSNDSGWQRHCTAQARVGPIGDLAISPDGRYLAVAGEANRAALIQITPSASGPAREPTAAAGQGAEEQGCGPLQRLEGHTGRIYSVAFSPDSAQLVTASLDKTARLWSSKGEALAILVGHQDRIYRAEFSPDGDWILTGSRDRSIRIWKRPRQIRNPVEVLSTFLPLEADSGGVANAVFSPDGHYVAGAYWENAAILWRLWSEDTELPDEDRSEWGADRSKLALVQEAYRFARDNRPTQSLRNLQAEPTEHGGQD